MAGGIGSEGDNHEPRCVHIESVGSGLFDTTREHEFYSVGHTIYFFRPSPRDRKHSADFVDDDKAGIGVKNFKHGRTRIIFSREKA